MTTSPTDPPEAPVARIDSLATLVASGGWLWAGAGRAGYRGQCGGGCSACAHANCATDGPLDTVAGLNGFGGLVCG